MKLLIQRVSHAHVVVDGLIISKIGPGALIFIGISHQDSEVQAKWLAEKFVHLRMFEDEEGKINRSLLESKGEALVVSQFTLYADCNGGRRPSFTQAAKPEQAKALYEFFVHELRQKGISVQTGIFAADMKVSLLNDGPVTLILEK